MSLENNGTSMVMPVVPSGGYNNYGGMGMGYGNDWWFIILLLFCFGGFGGYNMGGGMYGPGMMGAMGGMIYPWMNQVDAMNSGFQTQALNSNIGDLRSDVTRGFGDSQLAIAALSQQLCQCCGNMSNSMSQGFAQAEISANNRQMANMQQSFANVQAIDSRLDTLAMNQQQLGSNISSGIEGLKYTIATENCADRYEASQNTRDIIDAINNKAQMLNDKMCQLELDNYKNQLEAERRESANLRNQLTLAANRADNIANTSAILAGQVQRANEVIQNVNPTPIPSYNVQNPRCCNYNGSPCQCNGQMVA